MGPSTALLVLQTLDAALALALQVGINVERFQAMKAANGGAPLTPEQLGELEAEVDAKLGRH